MPDPIQEMSPSSLDELFQRDPLKLLDQDIALIVARLREQRTQWLVVEAENKNQGTRKRAPKIRSDLGELDVEVAL